MRRIIATAALLMGLATSALWADIGPRPPVQPTDVKNPQDHLTMVDETVNVTIEGRTAHVVADFHFQSEPLWRTILNMRLGFPHLRSDPPYRGFRVMQSVDAVDPPTTEVRCAPDRSTDPRFSAGLDADWLGWPLTLTGSNGAPQASDVRTRVIYDQDIALSKGGKTGTFRYVLRSGAPWKGAIGEARVLVKVGGATVVTARPLGVRGGGAKNIHQTTLQDDRVTWKMTDIDPTEDIVVTLRYR